MTKFRVFRFVILAWQPQYIHYSSFNTLAEFVCVMVIMSCLEAKAIPPCSDSLELHTSRANYEAYIWKNYLQQHPQIPLPDDYSWNQDGDGVVSIKWNTVQLAPDKILGLMFCTFSRKYAVGSCPCIDNSLICTGACTKQDCKNMMVVEEVIEIDYESDEDKE